MPDNVIINEPVSRIKAVGRQALKGHWFTTIWVMLINIAITSLPSIILTELIKNNDNVLIIAQVYSYLVIGPLNLGLSIYFLRMFRGEKADQSDLLSGFQHFRNAFGLYISVIVREVLWTFLFIIPGLVAIFRYSMAFFILADHPDYPPVKCIEESCRLMNGNKDKLFRLILSLAGWFILAELPRLAVDLYARGYTVESFDPSNQETFRTIVDTVMLGPVTLWGFAAGAGLILVEIYLNASECCFYDMLTENIVFKVYEPEEVTETQLASENEAAELIEETENDENN